MLGILPSELGNLDGDDLNFLRAGVLWDLEISGERGSPLLML
jgi:hypothetical protein